MTSKSHLQTLKISLGQLAPLLGDVQANVQRHVEMIKESKTRGSDLVLFPELSLTGYQLKDLVPDVALQVDSKIFQKLVKESKGLCLGFGFVEESEDHRFFNSYVVCEDGRIAHIHRKVYLPTYGLFEEGRLYAAGEHIRAFPSKLGRLGVVVCEDVWHPSTMYILAQDGAKLIIAAAASPIRGADVGESGSNIDVWSTALKMYSQLFGCFVILVNRSGFEDGLSFWGGSRVFSPGGRLAFEAPLLEEGLFHCQVEWGEIRRYRLNDPTVRSERLDITLAELQRIAEERRRTPLFGEPTSGDKD